MKTPTGTSESQSPAPPKKRVGPFTFISQVRAEARKVTWTSFPGNCIAASIMVVIMVLVAAIFFYATDTIVKLLVGFATGIWHGAPTNG